MEARRLLCFYCSWNDSLRLLGLSQGEEPVAVVLGKLANSHLNIVALPTADLTAGAVTSAYQLKAGHLGLR